MKSLNEDFEEIKRLTRLDDRYTPEQVAEFKHCFVVGVMAGITNRDDDAIIAECDEHIEQLWEKLLRRAMETN